MLPQVTVSGRAVSFSPHYPPGAAAHRLHDSQCYYATGRYGSILVQHLPLNGFSVAYTVMHITARARIRLAAPQSFCCCHINLEQQPVVSTAQTGAFRCRRHSATLICATTFHCTLQVQKQREYRLLTIFYPLPFVLQQLSFFPKLEPLRQLIARNRQILLPNAVAPLPAVLAKRVHQVIYLPVLPLTAAYYKDNLQEVFRDICRRLSQQAPPEPHSSIQEVERIRAVKEWIDTHLDQHFSIPELAKKAGINECKLKRGFRELYGSGVYAYLLHQRLLTAKTALEQTQAPVRLIARRAGYRYPANFSAAFKRAFGMSPGDLRSGNLSQ